jgi:hypothetical protein
MTEFDLIYMSYISDRILKDPEIVDIWVQALREHLAYLQSQLDQGNKRSEFYE